MPESIVATARPALSVVIASVNGYEYIAQCLCSLERQCARDLAEVIVTEGSGDDTAARIAEEYPWARVFPFATARTIPQLRTFGIRQARAEIVVTTEDHCVFDEHWYERIIQAHREHPDAAIGGAVENGSRRLVDWAVYICEYGKFMLPFPAGPAADLAGPNVSYKREVLDQVCGDLLDRGVWENVLHERLLLKKQGLRLDPSIVVYHAKRFRVGDFLQQRYYFGRSYAAVRVERAPFSKRAFYTVVAPLLPPLFLVRYARYFFGKRRFIREFMQTVPLLVLFAAAWSVGEFFGYALGDGGASLRVK